MLFNNNYLPKSDVVFTVMFLDKKLCEITLHAILGKEIKLIDIVAEAKNDLHQAALNSIYFDIRTESIDGRIFTLDLQRKYSKDRIRNRTVYYACREVASQQVSQGEYEKLKNVVISFILTEAPLIHTSDNSKIQLQNCITGEVYSDLLTIYEVNIKHINQSNSFELQILKDFLEIENQIEFDKFIFKYGSSEYGKLLIEGYLKAVSNPSLLDILKGSDKFMIKLTDEERIEIKEAGIKEGIKEGKYEKAIKTAKVLLMKDIDINTIIEATDLTKEEIESLK